MKVTGVWGRTSLVRLFHGRGETRRCLCCPVSQNTAVCLDSIAMTDRARQTHQACMLSGAEAVVLKLSFLTETVIHSPFKTMYIVVCFLLCQLHTRSFVMSLFAVDQRIPHTSNFVFRVFCVDFSRVLRV